MSDEAITEGGDVAPPVRTVTVVAYGSPDLATHEDRAAAALDESDVDAHVAPIRVAGGGAISSQHNVCTVVQEQGADGYPTGPCTTLYDLVQPRHWLGMGPYHLMYSPQEHKSTGNDGS